MLLWFGQWGILPTRILVNLMMCCLVCCARLCGQMEQRACGHSRSQTRLSQARLLFSKNLFIKKHSQLNDPSLYWQICGKGGCLSVWALVTQRLRLILRFYNINSSRPYFDLLYSFKHCLYFTLLRYYFFFQIPICWKFYLHQYHQFFIDLIFF